jgi:signal transduction histidine kinase
MTAWLGGKWGFGLAFCAISLLVAGGLAWATFVVLELEQQQRVAQAQAERNTRLRLALWRLDARIFPVLAREAHRPFTHYRALASVPGVLVPHGKGWQKSDILQPSPLLDEPRPNWLRLHFQVAPEQAPTLWESPQAPSASDLSYLEQAGYPLGGDPVAASTRQLLQDLRARLDTATIQQWLTEQRRRAMSDETTSVRTEVATHQPQPPPPPPPVLQSNLENNDPQVRRLPSGGQGMGTPYQMPDQEFQNRAVQRQQLEQANIFPPQRAGRGVMPSGPAATIQVQVGPLQPWWLFSPGQPDLLLFARWVQIGQQSYCQGFLVDHLALAQELSAAVADLFPQATLVPERSGTPTRPEQTMAALPFVLEPNEPLRLLDAHTWSTLHLGLGLAWLAALIGLTAVGLGGWALLDLSERRIRFVSTVTHELRTPLTTLRLYADMLTSGLIADPTRQREYLQTLHQEAERLHRLIANVLDYSKLERHRVQVQLTPQPLGGLLEETMRVWSERCRQAGKILVLEKPDPLDVTSRTDVELVQQILGNLMDNACKYSQGASDERIWLRARVLSPGTIALEVEDRGPGVDHADVRRIFAAFQRGGNIAPTTPGVGLGLALAQRWARLLGGRLELLPPSTPPGVRFRLTLTA